MTILSWSIPSHLDTANRKRLSDQRELYLVFDFSRCDTRLDVEQNFVTSLIHQCLTLRPQLFNIAKVMCQLVLDLRSGSISSDQLWSLLRQLLSASDDHRVFLIVVAIHQAQRADTSELNIFKRLLRLADDHIMLRRLRILVTGRAAIKTESHEPLHIDLAGSEESRAARQQALSEESRAALQPALFLKAASMRLVWDYVEKITENPFFSISNYSDTMLRASLLESTNIPSTRASLPQDLQSIGSTDQVRQLLLSNLENFDKAKEALNWIFHATRPLTVSELSVAIALSSICKGGKASELELPAGEDAMKLFEDNITWDLRKELQGIIGKAIKVVGPMGNVCFINNTFRQYFECCQDLFVSEFHSLITQRCLAYISRVAKHMDGSSGQVRNSSRALALLGYADLNWAEHYKLSVNPNSLLDQTATAFLLGDEGAAWFERLEINAEKILDAVDGDPLVMAAERGLTNVVKGVLRSPLVKGWNSEVAFQAAIWRGDLGIFKIILPIVLPFPEPTFPRRCLNLASEYGRTELANVIISNIDKGDIDALVNAEDSPCLVAAKNGHMETLTALLDRLPEDAVLQTDSSSRTVIHWAAAWGDADALRKLDERKGVRAKMFSTDSKTSTLLHLAAAAGSVETVEFLLDVAKELVEKKDGDNLTALHLAAKEGHKAVVSTLIKARADVWARNGDDKDAICALELVAAAGHLPIFSLLVDEMKKSPEGENKQEDKRISDDESDDSHLNRLAKLKGHFRTSLAMATCAGHSHIVRYILRQGGEYVPSIDLCFLQDNFLKSHCLDIIKVFVSEGVDLYQGMGAGMILLEGAVQDGRADMVRYIVNALPKEPLKARNINTDIKDGGNLLHYAAIQGHSAVMRELLKHHQANSFLQDRNRLDDKPLDTAVVEGHEAVVKEILRTRSNTTASKESRTIFRAVQAKRVSIMRLLLDNGWKADYGLEYILCKATSTGQTEMVKLLLERSNTSLLKEMNRKGNNLLYIAVSKKHTDIVKHLLDSGADPNVLNPFSVLSPLHLLCKFGGENAEEILKEFASIEDGASKTEGKHRKMTDFSLPSPDGSTALHYAINLKDLGLIRILLEQKPNLDAEVTETRTTPLMAAITKGIDIEVIKLFLRPEAKADLDKRDSENMSALDRAIEGEQWPIVKELVEAGAEVNPKDIGDNPTPLYAVISKENLPMVEFLLSKGANPNLSGQKSLPPFELALFQGNKDIAKAILESDKLDLKTNSAQYSLGSHLHAALFTGQREIFEMVAMKGANTEGSAPPYGKPIHLAISLNCTFNECRYFVEKLVHIGAQVDDKDLGGRTALSLSVIEFPESDISFLLNLGANPNLPDRLGATSLHYAAQTGSNDNLKRLIERGGKVERKDKCNRSVLYRAAMSGDHNKFMTVLESLPEDCRIEHLAAAIYPAVARRAADIVLTILKGTTIDFSARDRNGWTVLEIAEAYGHEELISILRENAGEPVEVMQGGKIEPSVWDPNDSGPRINLFGNNLEGSIKGAASIYLDPLKLPCLEYKLQ
jgi:ankyrin repeat protein